MQIMKQQTVVIGILVAIGFAFTVTSDASAACPHCTAVIFDGQSLDGWVSQGGDDTPTSWKAEDGVLHFDPSDGTRGSIMTDYELGDFDFRFQWKISPGGNSGVKYRFKQFGNSWLGCEHQVLDDSTHRDGHNPKTSASSLYHMLPASEDKQLNPVGEWNQSRIVVQGNHLRHYLNGQLVVDMWTGTEAWDQAKAASKFSKVEGFGENHLGRLMLQDHGDEVWYRNLTVRPLCQCTRNSLTDAELPRLVSPMRTPLRSLLRRLLTR